MSYLLNSGETIGLGIDDFLKNVAELHSMGMAPSESYSCCATGTCS